MRSKCSSPGSLAAPHSSWVSRRNLEPVQILSPGCRELLSHLAAIYPGLSWGCRTALGDPEQAITSGILTVLRQLTLPLEWGWGAWHQAEHSSTGSGKTGSSGTAFLYEGMGRRCPTGNLPQGSTGVPHSDTPVIPQQPPAEWLSKG